MKRALIVIAAFGILGAAAVGHGLRTDRWGPSADLLGAAAKLQDLPKEIGDWTSQDSKLSDAELGIAQVAGYLVRQYRHKYTHESVTVMILCGRPGPVAVHTPEVCYAGAGFVPGPATKLKLADSDVLWQADFVKAGAASETLRILWGWSTEGTLLASDSPRTDFARSKALYKIYIIRSVSGPGPAAEAESKPEMELLNSLRPFLQKSLSLGS